MRIIAIVLIALGIVGLAYGGISFTRQEKVVDLGPVQVSHDQTHSIPVPPIAGAVCLVAGILLILPRRRAVS